MINFIFMLTHHDRTVANAEEVLAELRGTGLALVGCKDVGATPARLRDLVGTSRLNRVVPEGETVGGLLTALYDEFPPLRAWDAHLLLAVGLEFADRVQALRDGDTVSVMPPVQGG